MEQKPPKIDRERSNAGEGEVNEPTEEEIKAAREVTQPYYKQINDTPALMSLLYDIDLLPEQIRLFVNAKRMVAVCMLFKLVPPEVLEREEKAK
jgi:hypothetical protein